MKTKIIYGPPGTGKTTRLMSILEKELAKVSSLEVAFCSFTRKGSYEGRDRACEKFGYSKDDFPFFRTIHSIAFSQVEAKKTDMIKKEHFKAFSEALGMNFTGYYTEDLNNDDDKYLFFETLYRNNPAIAEELMNDLNPKLLKWVTNNYRRFKKEFNIMDFTDLLEKYLEIGEALPVKVAFIDEAQDITTLQWKVIWKAFKNCKRVYIAGDDDQAIYEWSGADVKYFLNLKGEQEFLHKSWRLPECIHKYSDKITELISNRIEKPFISNGEKGAIEVFVDVKEIDIDPKNEWLVLARNNYHLYQVEKYLREKAILYERHGKRSVNLDIVKGINAHTKKMRGDEITDTESNILAYYMDGCQTPFKEAWFLEFNRLKDETIDYYRDIIANKTDVNKCNIKLSTIHGAKGGECENVILLLEHNKMVDTYKNKSVNNYDNEMRCYYVGATRAKEKLYIVLPSGRYGYDVIK